MRELVRELPPGGVLSDDLFLETARGFDLFGDTVAIADRVAGRVPLFCSEGEHIATLGGPSGPGDPDVLQSPMRVEFAPDGALWVGDLGRGALVRFPPGEGEPRTVRLPVISTAAGFGVDHVLGPVGPSVEPGFLLTAYAAGDRPLNIPSEVPIPAELAYEASWRSRIGTLNLVVSGGRKGEVVLLDAMETILWRIELEYEPPRIVRISRIPVPRWLVESTRAEMARIVEGRPGVRAPGFKDMRAGERGVWLVPAIDPVDGLFLPYEEGGRTTVLWRDPLHEEAWSSRVLDDTAWQMYPGSLRLFTIADEG